MRRMSIFLILIMTLALGLSACSAAPATQPSPSPSPMPSEAPSPSPTPKPQEEAVRVALYVRGRGSRFWQQVIRGAQDEIEQSGLNMELLVFGPLGEPFKTEEQQILDGIKKLRPDVLIIDGAQNAAGVTAQFEGIPVLCIGGEELEDGRSVTLNHSGLATAAQRKLSDDLAGRSLKAKEWWIVSTQEPTQLEADFSKLLDTQGGVQTICAKKEELNALFAQKLRPRRRVRAFVATDASAAAELLAYIKKNKLENYTSVVLQSDGQEELEAVREHRAAAIFRPDTFALGRQAILLAEEFLGSGAGRARQVEFFLIDSSNVDSAEAQRYRVTPGTHLGKKEESAD